ncbi:MAG: type II secretion system minor pseudopilin GspJ [Hahellaceae bacterium]|nr:type II secretion system minor pseudopilin GspJ [Hahellaceae bacterium]MCP5212976.1 type II secretion system minor pseudopilin GspJ [Hahellaceae bacterium]
MNRQQGCLKTRTDHIILKRGQRSLSIRGNGFTLIEVLIAIAVTAALGLGVWQILNSTIRTQQVLARQQGILESLQRTFLLIDRDFQQLVSRPIRNEFGDTDYVISNRNTLYKIELTRAGWRNPLGDKRSELQRVAYELQDKQLRRTYWQVLDRAQDSEPRSMVLDENISAFKVSFLTDKNQWVGDWPTEESLGGEDGVAKYAQLPKAMRVEIEHDLYGKIYRVFSAAQSLDLTADAEPDNNAGDNAGNNGGNVPGANNE